MTVSKAQELAAKRITLAKHSREDLEKWSKTALRKEAKGIVSGLNKASKEEIIEGILAATQAERQLEIIIPDLSKEDKIETRIIADNLNEISQNDIGSFCEQFYKDFRKSVQKLWDAEKEIWISGSGMELSSLGYQITSYLDGYRKDDGTSLANSTQLRYRAKILNTLKDMVNLEKTSIYYTMLSSGLEMVERACKIQTRKKSVEKMQKQATRIAERKHGKQTIDFKPIFDYAVDVFQKLDSLPSYRWCEVSIALVIVTGRRPSEIHSSGSFEVVSANVVSFTGQLKARGKAAEWYAKNPSYEIPTLVPAEMVVKAMTWITDKNKRVDTPEKAHSRYSKDLSEALKKERITMGVDLKQFTFKGVRAVYGQVCEKCFQRSDKTQYLANIFGHGRGDHKAAESGIYTDMLTPQSYDADFEVINPTYLQG